MSRLLLIIVAIAAGACSRPGTLDATDNAIELEPCRLRGSSGLTSVAAECGRFTVAENPADASGATIDLFVARIPALSRRSPDSAFTLFAGGPGQAATEFYADYAGAFERIHRYQDIVLVDQRGTGQSARLDCHYTETGMLEFSAEYSASLATACLDQLANDPRYFTTSVAVRDVDKVRAALGYRQLNLYGISYGTRVAQHYLKRYPEHVRTVVLDGVVPADTILGLDIAPDAQAALQNIFRRCANDPACNRQFPALDATFEQLSKELRAGPIELALPSPISGKLKTTQLNYDSFAGTVRLLSYTPLTTALLPLLLHEAGANDNWLPLAAQAQMTMEALADAISEGMHNAVVCTEDVPFLDFDGPQYDALADTYLGDLQVVSLTAVCEVWPAGIIDDGFHAPLRSDTPVMLLSGTDDPITPPRNGDKAAAHLSNRLHIVGQGHGHGMLTRGCVPDLIADFIETASFDELDADCVDKQSAEPFFTSFSGPDP